MSGSRRPQAVARAALVALLLGAPACSESEPEPVTTAKRFAAAVRRGDVEAALPLLERRVVERLEQSAQRASDQVGGRRNIEPREMLQIVDVAPELQVAEAEVLESTDSTARVQLTGASGVQHVLSLVYEEGAWRVSIPVPPTPPPSDL